ncbi:MAG TPA: lmo0937 family membrane protein [Candidatus Dormibacteraeota bacterium]|nr:lmo0937 family membrane protein [Candidatus Dormibacteraeota bacterium]
MTSLIWLIVVVLVVMWLLGFSLHVAGNLIFLLLLLAIAGVVYNLLAGGMWGGGATTHHHHTEVTEVEHDV